MEWKQLEIGQLQDKVDDEIHRLEDLLKNEIEERSEEVSLLRRQFSLVLKGLDILTVDKHIFDECALRESGDATSSTRIKLLTQQAKTPLDERDESLRQALASAEPTLAPELAALRRDLTAVDKTTKDLAKAIDKTTKELQAMDNKIEARLLEFRQEIAMALHRAEKHAAAQFDELASDTFVLRDSTRRDLKHIKETMAETVNAVAREMLKHIEESSEVVGTLEGKIDVLFSDVNTLTKKNEALRRLRYRVMYLYQKGLHHWAAAWHGRPILIGHLQGAAGQGGGSDEGDE